eukprot:TRINITY_DN60759_c0_g1_i1.p1 TRINITY_DN60759_c0_g1~~TRINITY_DN60759_c0_g1_i1.p1  ORF type:complete len:409 (+),score=51.81 TRINITY_DN60759_c0_g1_i1:119-1228(+)
MHANLHMIEHRVRRFEGLSILHPVLERDLGEANTTSGGDPESIGPPVDVTSGRVVEHRFISLGDRTECVGMKQMLLNCLEGCFVFRGRQRSCGANNGRVHSELERYVHELAKRVQHIEDAISAATSCTVAEKESSSTEVPVVGTSASTASDLHSASVPPRTNARSSDERCMATPATATLNRQVPAPRDVLVEAAQNAPVTTPSLAVSHGGFVCGRPVAYPGDNIDGREIDNDFSIGTTVSPKKTDVRPRTEMEADCASRTGGESNGGAQNRGNFVDLATEPAMPAQSGGGVGSARRQLGRANSAPEPPSSLLVGKVLCCICMEAPRDCAFTPCGHRCVCRVCGNTTVRTDRRCPICRVAIGRVLRILDP